MHTRSIHHLTLVAAIAGSFALAAFAAEQTDIGSVDKARLEKVHPSKPAYSPYAEIP